MKAKEILRTEANFHPRMFTKVAMSHNVLEIIKLLQTCDDDNIALPNLLIFQPEKVFSIPGETAVIVTHNFTERCNKLDILMEQNFSKSKPVTTEVPAEYISKSSYAVIVKNASSNLAKLQSRKDFQEQACGDVSSKLLS